MWRVEVDALEVEEVEQVAVSISGLSFGVFPMTSSIHILSTLLEEIELLTDSNWHTFNTQLITVLAYNIREMVSAFFRFLPVFTSLYT